MSRDLLGTQTDPSLSSYLKLQYIKNKSRLRQTPGVQHI